MDAVEFLKEKARMTNECQIDCKKCPLGNYCIGAEGKNAERMVAIVEKWAAEHPAKTRQSEFLKMFPNAENYSGTISICPQKLDKNIECLYRCGQIACNECRKQYWLEEVVEEGN